MNFEIFSIFHLSQNSSLGQQSNSANKSDKQFHIYRNSIVFIFMFITLYQSSPIVIQPYITYDPYPLEAGTHTFLPTDDYNLTTVFQATFTVIYTKIHTVSPYVILGFNQMEFYINTLASGFTDIVAVVANASQTKFDISHYSFNQSNLVKTSVNYLIIHDGFTSTKQVFGISCTSPSPFTSALSSTNTMTYPKALAIPHLNYRYFISITRLLIQRNNNISQPFSFQLSPANLTLTSINLVLNCSFITVNGWVAYLILYDISYQNIFPQIIQISTFLDTFPITTVSSFNFTQILPHNIKNNTFFIGLGLVNTLDSNFQYKISHNPTTDILDGLISYIGTDIFYTGIAFYGYECGAPFYLSSDNTMCVKCKQNCLNCRQYPVYECLLCPLNFNFTAGNLGCICSSPLQLISGTCDSFTPNQLKACLNGMVINSTLTCFFCSYTDNFILINNTCQCKAGFNDTNSNQVCEQICGDGKLFIDQCDDGNLVENDGCNSLCQFEPDFDCDISVQPSYCKSIVGLRYEIFTIIKQESSHTVTLQLKLNNYLNLPFQIFKNQFQPQTAHIELILIMTQSPYQQYAIKDLNIETIDSLYTMRLKFTYQFSIQNLKSILNLNYQDTRYLNSTQKLKFTMQGNNSPLIYSTNLSTYIGLSYGELIGACLIGVLFILGILSSKFIGLQAIITLQLIFYSQLLIIDPKKWPIGFLYLKYLKITTGYNVILNLTDYYPFTSITKKLNHLDIHKTIIQNFHVNFIILIMVFVIFLIFNSFKKCRQNALQLYIRQQKKNKQDPQDNKKMYTHLRQNFIKSNQLNDKLYWVSNHISFWSILPIISAISAFIVIQNETMYQSSNYLTQSNSLLSILISFQGVFACIVIGIILFIVLSNFRSIWLHPISLKKLSEKHQENTYKKSLFIYLLVMGLLILCFNQITLDTIPFVSIIVLCFQIIYILILIMVNPYLQSLRIHSIGLMVNQIFYLIFLIIINMINLIQDLNETIILIMGYFTVALSLIIIFITSLRLYYQFRYGQALQKQIHLQRKRRQSISKQKQKDKLSNKRKKLQHLAIYQLSQNDKIRNLNRYLYQNQIKQQQKNSLIQWLQRKQWEPQYKEDYYFKRFTQKPLQWLKTNDQKLYLQKIKQIQKQIKSQEQKKLHLINDNSYRKISSKLKQSYVQSKWNFYKRLQRHQERLKNDTNYSMLVMKNNQHKLTQKQYEII